MQQRPLLKLYALCARPVPALAQIALETLVPALLLGLLSKLSLKQYLLTDVFGLLRLLLIVKEHALKVVM